MRVLIIEDDPTFRQLMVSTLRMAGHVAEAAVDGAKGIDTFQSASWDLVITDRVMPGMKGEEIAAVIKQIAPYVPVVLITAFPQGIGHSPLFDAILTKPFHPKHLIALLASFDTRSKTTGPSGPAPA